MSPSSLEICQCSLKMNKFYIMHWPIRLNHCFRIRIKPVALEYVTMTYKCVHIFQIYKQYTLPFTYPVQLRGIFPYIVNTSHCSLFYSLNLNASLIFNPNWGMTFCWFMMIDHMELSSKPFFSRIFIFIHNCVV